ncbi:MAG: GLUG motif-containing protein [Planctomycetota bacterium]
MLSAFCGYVPPQLPGQGTPEDPYLISAPVDLGTVYHNPGGCYKLVASVDLSGIKWSAAALPAFAGVFDGNGQTIENLTISGKGLIGLFGWLQKGSQVKNLGVVDANVVGVDYENGILAGCNLGSVINCYSSGYIQASGYVGGLIGNNERGGITDCHSTASVRGGGDVGGLVGRNLDGIVDNCHSTGSVDGRDVDDTVGGLVGSNHQEGRVSNSYSTGVVCGVVSDGDDRRWGSVGGLVGANTYGRLTDCYSTSEVTGDTNVGGLVGRNGISGWGPGLAGIVANCCSTGEVSGNTSVGGLLGCNEKGRIDNCHSTAAVSGDMQIGGLGGKNQDSIFNCYSTGAVIGNADVGGLLGQSRGDVTACFWDIETSSLTSSVGGTGKTTSQMQTPDTFLEAGWDFIDETANGTDDIWWILEGQSYPQLWWETGN